MKLNSSLLKSLRLYLWLIRGYFKRHRLKILFIFFILIITGLIFSSVFSSLPKFERTYTEGFIGSYEPSNLPDEILSLVGEGLTTILPDGEAGPGLARQWEASESGTIYTFHLRPNLFWHDGTRVKTQDLKFNFADVEVIREDDSTIKFKLKNSFSPFPTILAQPIFKNDTLIGTGSYKVESMEISRSDVLSYFSKKNLLPSQEKLSQRVTSITLVSKTKKPNKIKFRFYQTEEMALSAIKLGEIQGVSGIINPNGFKNWNNLNIYSKQNKNTYVAVMFNTKDSLTADKTLRQALAYAIPTNDFRGTPATSPINKTSWAYNPDVKKYNYDPQKATDLLKKVPDTTKSGELKITLSVISTYQKLAEDIKKSWDSLGVKTNIKLVSDLSQISATKNF